MSRTPLFAAMRRALRLAQISDRTGMGASELIERREFALSRRGFLRASLAAGAAFTVEGVSGCAVTGNGHSREGDQPRIVIIGAGLAGLSCAYQLKKAGIRATIYDAAERVGGRVFTKRDILAKGLVTEVGGEFIDSSASDMLDLCREFQLGVLDLTSDTLAGDAYFFGGKHYSEAEAIEAFKPLAERIAQDATLVPEEPEKPLAMEFMVKRTQARKKFDEMPLSAYFDRLEISGWLRALLEAAYTTEYGLDVSEHSTLNFLSMIGTDVSRGLRLLGESDERFKISGGNLRLIDALASNLGSQIEPGRKLIRLQKRGNRTVCYFDYGDTEADIVVLALPFTMLREVDNYLEMPEEKKCAIRELGYGNNAKVMFGVNSRPWRKQGRTGNAYSEEAFQCSWDNARMQVSERDRGSRDSMVFSDKSEGGMTFYLGGSAAKKIGTGTPREALDKLMPGIEKVFPGITKEFNEHFGRMHWPGHPFTKASYASYKVGQWTTIRGNEQTPVGNVYFAGEHCSLDFQGFMNGAAQTGREAAEAIIAKVKK